MTTPKSNVIVMKLSGKEIFKRVLLFWFGVSSVLLGGLVVMAGFMAPGLLNIAYVETKATITEVQEVKAPSSAIVACDLSYSYVAEESTYYGHVLEEKPGAWTTNECAETFPVDSTFTIFYNSLDNSLTVDELPSGDAVARPILITGGIVAIIGVTLIVLGGVRVARKKGLVPAEVSEATS